MIPEATINGYNKCMDLAALYDELRKGAVQGARALLGWKLVHETSVGRIAGYIVETEAYTEDDPASHTYRGLSKRNAPMFDEAGSIYVYFTYGMHYCVNIVCGVKGRGEGVLIRALEPVEGIEIMKQRRNVIDERNLTSGPGKITQALAITKEMSGSVLGDTLHLEAGFTPELITQTERVGISRAKEQQWRFYISNNPYISRK
jgi:DNA-3-methyladenine glycosylase